MVVELADFMNGNSKISQMKHCHCLKFSVTTDVTCTFYGPEKQVKNRL